MTNRELDLCVVIANVAVMAFMCITLTSLPTSELGTVGIVAGILAWADFLYFVGRLFDGD